MIKKVEGVIVKEIPYKESSKIITVFTKDDGIIGIYAKGVRKLTSKIGAKVNKLTYGYFHIKYNENGLSSLIDIEIIDPLKNIKKDLTMICYASFLSELSSQVYRHDNNKEIYNLYINSILKINSGYNPLVISNILELKLLSYLGIKPVIDNCVECGGKEDIVTLSSYKGGYICKRCLTNEKIVLSKTIKLIRMFYYVDISKISNISISDEVENEINSFIDDYYERYSGLYLKSKEFLRNINELQT